PKGSDFEDAVVRIVSDIEIFAGIDYSAGGTAAERKSSRGQYKGVRNRERVIERTYGRVRVPFRGQLDDPVVAGVVNDQVSGTIHEKRLRVIQWTDATKAGHAQRAEDGGGPGSKHLHDPVVPGIGDEQVARAIDGKPRGIGECAGGRQASETDRGRSA